VALVERAVAGAFRYELVTESGDSLGLLTSENDAFEVGDCVSCNGHVYEVQAVDGDVLRVRRVI
jgi:hypothetical protein